MSVHPYTSPLTGSFAATRNTALLQAAMAILLGFFVIGVVGFSHIDVVHNAAHDTRHSNAFPCH
jgi:cobalt transporter subunit CbtB